MSKLKEIYLDSMKELGKTKNIALLGLMAALSIVLGYVASISIGPYLKIGFSGIPNRIVDACFGPIVGCIFGGVLDTVKFMIKPDGTFFFGFTFDAMLAGLIYGSILCRKEISIPRIFIAELIVKVVVNCGFNTLWISMLYGKGFMALLPLRIIRNAVALPVDTMILFLVFTVVGPVTKHFKTIPWKKRSVNENQ